ncbi:hypothetical protein AV530_009361 [Patagioenas fasciata monilis]|uniref:Uncharacterized protein n=1 Tax=Patagioenas fasciata monilis TaxID=372326 RepID=A0A1V4JIX4_PATFA|nr:hypothetical protein AV530_009361 [Patagioenas fasciata monilis]
MLLHLSEGLRALHEWFLISPVDPVTRPGSFHLNQCLSLERRCPLWRLVPVESHHSSRKPSGDGSFDVDLWSKRTLGR